MREQAVRLLSHLIRDGVGSEAALARTAREFRFAASKSSLRRWDRAYALRGFSGLLEAKVGRVGRKPKI